MADIETPKIEIDKIPEAFREIVTKYQESFAGLLKNASDSETRADLDHLLRDMKEETSVSVATPDAKEDEQRNKPMQSVEYGKDSREGSEDWKQFRRSIVAFEAGDEVKGDLVFKEYQKQLAERIREHKPFQKMVSELAELDVPHEDLKKWYEKAKEKGGSAIDWMNPWSSDQIPPFMILMLSVEQLMDELGVGHDVRVYQAALEGLKEDYLNKTCEGIRDLDPSVWEKDQLKRTSKLQTVQLFHTFRSQLVAERMDGVVNTSRDVTLSLLASNTLRDFQDFIREQKLEKLWGAEEGKEAPIDRLEYELLWSSIGVPTFLEVTSADFSGVGQALDILGQSDPNVAEEVRTKIDRMRLRGTVSPPVDVGTASTHGHTFGWVDTALGGVSGAMDWVGSKVLMPPRFDQLSVYDVGKGALLTAFGVGGAISMAPLVSGPIQALLCVVPGIGEWNPRAIPGKLKDMVVNATKFSRVVTAGAAAAALGYNFTDAREGWLGDAVEGVWNAGKSVVSGAVNAPGDISEWWNRTAYDTYSAADIRYKIGENSWSGYEELLKFSEATGVSIEELTHHHQTIA
ncbi:MAG: hypothetical protein Q8P95_01705, partial [bacterium]|nr:hypothetical protein [bacterium]